MNGNLDIRHILREAFGDVHADPAFRGRMALAVSGESPAVRPSHTKLSRFLEKRPLAFASLASVMAGVGVAVMVGVGSSSSAPRHQPPPRGLPPNLSACPPPATIGYLVKLAPGHSSAELAADGYAAAPMSGVPGLVLVGPTETTQIGTAPPTSDLANALPREAAVQQFGALLSQASAADLQSCNYTLADRPDAQPYLDAARTALMNAGFITATQLSESPTYSLSDDPLDSGELVVTVDVQGPQVTGGVGPSDRFTTLRFAAIVDRSSHDVVAVGAWPA